MASNYSIVTSAARTTPDILQLLLRPRFERLRVRARSLLIQKDVARRLKRGPPDALDASGETLRALLSAALFGFDTPDFAARFCWDGSTYIPLGLRAGAESVLRLPEALSGTWPDEADALDIHTIDVRTLCISPRQTIVEQRVFMRGESGRLYLVKASTGLTYLPMLLVQDATPRVSEAASPVSLPDMTPTTLMLEMMAGTLPTGFTRRATTGVLLVAPDYRIDAVEVWSSSGLTGVITTIRRTAASGCTVEIKPKVVPPNSPGFGRLKIIGADRWTLDDATPSVQGYLVFVKD